jgi:hypothetical protein
MPGPGAPKSGNTGLIIGIVLAAVGVLVLGGIGAAVFTRNSPKYTAAPTLSPTTTAAAETTTAAPTTPAAAVPPPDRWGAIAVARIGVPPRGTDFGRSSDMPTLAEAEQSALGTSQGGYILTSVCNTQ